jgi:hypothetical protein
MFRDFILVYFIFSAEPVFHEKIGHVEKPSHLGGNTT